MDHRGTTLLSISFLIICVILKLTLAYPYGLSLLSDSLDDQPDLSQSGWDLPSREMLPSKRDCAGFPCMYTHMAEKAGKHSVNKVLAELLRECIENPECYPGKRRRRSIRLDN